MKWIWYADLGNCTLHWSAWAGNAWRTSGRISVEHLETVAGLRLIMQKLADSGLALGDCQQAVVCVSSLTKDTLIEDLAREFLHTETQIMGRDFQADIPTEYYDPAQVGQDRLANALAAIELYGTPAVVLDFGSCLTCDAISVEGVFVGGAIAPGLPAYHSGIESVAPHLEAAGQEAISSKDIPVQRPGRSTVECLALGIYYGLAGAADRLVAIMRQYVAEEASVIATGGDAPTLAPLCQTEMSLEPMLTLDGLRLACQYSRDKRTQS